MKKHRKFAEDPRNWTHLDDLLSQLERVPKYVESDDEELPKLVNIDNGHVRW